MSLHSLGFVAALCSTIATARASELDRTGAFDRLWMLPNGSTTGVQTDPPGIYAVWHG